MSGVSNKVARHSIPVSVQRQRNVVVLATAAGTGTRTLKKPAAKSGQIYVAGATGQVAISFVKEFATAGYKVVAAVPDLEEAQAVLNFAKQYELIPRSALANVQLVEVDFADEDEVAASIPRRTKVVVVEGDTADRKRVDAKFVQTLVSAAEARDSQQLVLVTPLGGASSGTGFNLFGGGAAASAKSPRLTRTEELVQASSVPAAIVRAAGLDKAPAGKSNVMVGALGSFAPSLVAAKSQVAEVVSELLALPSGAVVLEVAAAADAPAEPVAGLVEEVAGPQLAESAAKAKAAAPAALFSFGAKPAAPKAEAKEEEEEEKPKQGTGMFSFGTLSIKRGASVDEEEEEEEEAPKKPLFGFGAPKPKKVEPEPPTPAGRRGGSVSRSRRPTASKDDEEEEKPKKSGGLFGWGAPAVQVDVGADAKLKVPARGSK